MLNKSLANNKAAFFLALIMFFSLVSPASAAQIELNNAPIREFIRWYTSTTGHSVVVSPAVTGEVTVYSAHVDLAEIQPFFTSVLRANGYAFTPGDPGVVEPLSRASASSGYQVPAIDPSFRSSTAPDFITQIDTPETVTETRTYNVRNLRAGDVAPVVEIFLARSATRLAASSVLPVDGANILVVQATEEQHAALAAFLPGIDTPRPQVLIESLMFEVSEGSTFDFSFAAGRATPRGSSDLVGGVQTSALGTALRSAGGSFGIFDGDVLGVSLRAVETDGTAEVLSTPQILTMSGSQGYISVGQNVPFITGRATGEAADITSPFQTIERRDVGVTLTVTPTVTSTGLVIMDISSTADSISESREASDIITNQRQVRTTVQLRDGQTLLLGGLISEDTITSETAVPFLGSIPGLGRLFRSTSESDEKRSLYIMLRATVLPNL